MTKAEAHIRKLHNALNEFDVVEASKVIINLAHVLNMLDDLKSSEENIEVRNDIRYTIAEIAGDIKRLYTEKSLFPYNLAKTTN